MAGKLVFESPRFVLKTGQRSRPQTAGAARSRAAAHRDPLPIVVGCPRTGTSLLAVMLDSHPMLAVPPETSFLPIVMALQGPAATLRERFFEIVTTDRIMVSNWTDFGLDAEALRERLKAIERFTVAAGVRAFYAMYAERERKPRYGDKTPGYVFSMPSIAALLPEAHFIHVIRDPGDTALSWRRTWFAPSQDFRVLGEAWRKHVETGRRAGATLRRYTELRFEELVREPERELRRLCDFLSLAWNPAMLDYRAQGAARVERLQGRLHARGPMIPREARQRIHSNLAQPLDAERAGVWRREMSAAERRELEAGAGSLVRELGYAA
jgi:Sulfotransferase family